MHIIGFIVRRRDCSQGAKILTHINVYFVFSILFIIMI